MNNVIVIGAKQGIGKYLAKRFNALTYCRGDVLNKADYNTIIFCAANAQFETPLDKLYHSIEDNLLLLERMSLVSHKRFIYFSSVDVYPQNSHAHTETENIKIEQLSGGYAAFKLMGEAIVRKRCNKSLILRPTSLFGPGMRPNNIMRMMVDKSASLSLKSTAQFNCITYDMIGEIIDAALQKDITGIYNCAASHNTSLEEIAQICNFEGEYGKHNYSVPTVSNDKVKALLPSFKASSLSNIKNIYRSLEA